MQHCYVNTAIRNQNESNRSKIIAEIRWKITILSTESVRDFAHY